MKLNEICMIFKRKDGNSKMLLCVRVHVHACASRACVCPSLPLSRKLLFSQQAVENTESSSRSLANARRGNWVLTGASGPSRPCLHRGACPRSLGNLSVLGCQASKGSRTPSGCGCRLLEGKDEACFSLRQDQRRPPARRRQKRDVASLIPRASSHPRQGFP